MLVIILAMIAIVTAVVIMVWPSSSRADDKNGLEPPPAPEHMQTKPSSTDDDPWGPSKSSSNGPASKDAVLAQISKHICDRAMQCTNHTIRDLCNVDPLHASVPAACSAATTRCLDHVDALACTAPLDDADALESLLAQVPECVDAIRC